MVYIRKIKPSLNMQEDSQLFTFVISYQQLDKDITRDEQKIFSK